VFNSFPYDEWSDTITDFWTWGGHNSTGTYIQLAVGFVLMVAALIAWVKMEDTKLERQAAMLRQAGAGSAPAAPDHSTPA
jgi:hypothetical protein